MSLDFTLESQLEKAIEILRRDITNLMIEGSNKKLSASSARDLVAYIKLLTELKQMEKTDLENLSNDDLKAMIDAASKQTEPT